MTRYLIADAMLFDDELYEIAALDNTLEPVVLGAAASRCFSTLLEAQGAIVTKKELLYEGWERYGQQVSANSVNQSIAQIRRCLSQLGLPSYVVTVPRIGYKIGDALSIVKHCDNAGIIKQTPEPAQTVAQAMSVAVIDDMPAIKPKGRGVTYLYVSVTVLLLLNALLAFGWNALQLSSPLGTAIDFSYLPVPGPSGLHLFATPGISVSPEQISAHMLKLKQTPPAFTSLASYAYVYLNGTLRDNAYSYFLCQQAIEVSGSDCISYLVVDESQ